MRLQVVYTEALESPRLFQRNVLNSTQGKKLRLTSSDVSTGANKADPYAIERSYKQGRIGDYDAGGIEMILALFEGLSVGCLTSGRTNPYGGS